VVIAAVGIGANRWRFKTYAETPGEEAWYVPPYYRKSGSKRGNRERVPQFVRWREQLRRAQRRWQELRPIVKTK
jgi:hypothetical protein